MAKGKKGVEIFVTCRVPCAFAIVSALKAKRQGVSERKIDGQH
jgi:hypothetical protein